MSHFRDDWRPGPELLAAYFDGELTGRADLDVLRQRVAERVGAKGTDAYSLLSQIGRDCVGALQFIPDGDDAVYDASGIDGKVISDEDIENLLNNLDRAPLGLDRDQDFRISVAGAQEKTALLLYDGMWLKPHGTTPTTNIFKNTNRDFAEWP